MLPKYFYEIVRPTPLKSVKLIHTHASFKQMIHPKIDSQNVAAWINGELILEDRFRPSLPFCIHRGKYQP